MGQQGPDKRKPLDVKIDVELFREVEEPVLALEKECFPDNAWERYDFISSEKAGGHLSVARHKGQIVGYAMYELQVNEGRMHLLNIGVHPDYRHMEVATQLIQDRVKKIGSMKEIRLEVRDRNPDAQALFKKLGFVCTHALQEYYEDTDEVAYVMRYSPFPDIQAKYAFSNDLPPDKDLLEKLEQSAREKKRKEEREKEKAKKTSPPPPKDQEEEEGVPSSPRSVRHPRTAHSEEEERFNNGLRMCEHLKNRSPIEWQVVRLDGENYVPVTRWPKANADEEISMRGAISRGELFLQTISPIEDYARMFSTVRDFFGQPKQEEGLPEPENIARKITVPLSWIKEKHFGQKQKWENFAVADHELFASYEKLLIRRRLAALNQLIPLVEWEAVQVPATPDSKGLQLLDTPAEAVHDIAWKAPDSRLVFRTIKPVANNKMAADIAALIDYDDEVPQKTGDGLNYVQISADCLTPEFLKRQEAYNRLAGIAEDSAQSRPHRYR